MTPLIDVVFLLITFFVFSLAVMIRADVLGVTLPDLASGERAERREVVTLSVMRDGTYAVNGEAVERALIIERIAAAREETPDAPLVIASDEDASAGDLIAVYDLLAGAGITEFQVVGRPSGGAGDSE